MRVRDIGAAEFQKHTEMKRPSTRAKPAILDFSVWRRQNNATDWRRQLSKQEQSPAGRTLIRRRAGGFCRACPLAPLAPRPTRKKGRGSKLPTRSEERRVGKESRSRWSPH